MYLGLSDHAPGALPPFSSDSLQGSVYCWGLGAIRRLSLAPGASGSDTESDTAGSGLASGLAFVVLIFPLQSLTAHTRVGYYYDHKPVPFLIFVRPLGGR